MFRGTRLVSLWIVVREPLRQSKADLSRAKDTFDDYGISCEKDDDDGNEEKKYQSVIYRLDRD